MYDTLKWLTPLFKVVVRYYKICTMKKLPSWMGHLIDCEQDNTLQTIIPSSHMALVSHTKC
jgi:hypothetical protein